MDLGQQYMDVYAGTVYTEIARLTCQFFSWPLLQQGFFVML